MTEFEIIEVSPERYRLSGELDMASAETLHAQLDTVAESNGHKKLILDVEELTFIDSAGLRSLVQLSDKLNGAAPLVLSNVSTGVRRLLDIVGLESLPGIEVEGSG